MSDSEREELIRLRQESAELRQLLKQANEANTELRKMLADLQEKLDILIAQLKKRNRKDFGNKTERHNPRPAMVADSPAAEKPVKPKSAPKPRNHIKHILKQNLPVEPVPHLVKAEHRICPGCDVETVFVRNEITNQLERLSHSLKRLQHEQEVRACPKCKKYVVTAEKPCPPIPGSYAAPGLLADISVSKLDDALPNYRQQKRFDREHAIIPRSTQSDWMQSCAALTEPLYDILKRETLASRIVQTDDTEIKVQDRNLKRNIRKGKMTVNRGDRRHPFVVFHFSPDQSFAQNMAFFKDYVGIVQADAARGFDALFRDGTKVEAGCNAHARRKFFEALEVHPIEADRVLDLYHRIYEIEKTARGVAPAVRLAIRRRKIKPLVKQLRSTILKFTALTPTDLLRKATEYTLAHWLALTRFLKDPEIEIDNNACERDIKHFVLDRKNFLFTGSNAGGKAIAILLSLIASARRNNVEPRAYLTDVFSRINSMKTSELPQLLPNRWVPQNQK